MMTRLMILLLTLGILLCTLKISWAESTSRTCALTKVFECTSESGCTEMSVQQMELPRFILIDVKAGTIRSLDRNVARVTPFKNVDRVEDMLVLHGTEKRGWSIAVGEKSGNLTLSASGDGESFVVFGSCMNP